MRFRIEVEGEQVSALLDSVSITKELDGRTSKATFSLNVGSGASAVYDDAVYDSATYYAVLPSQQSEVIIYDADTEAKMFRGFVVDIERTVKSATFQWWNCTCVGIEFLLEQITIKQTWTSTKPRAIIQAAFGSKLPEILTTNATVEDLGSAVNFEAKDITLRGLVERMAELADAEFFVNADKELVFRAAGSVTAPFAFDASPDLVDTFPYQKISSRRQSIGFANRVVALGGFFGTLGAELRSQVDNTASQTAMGRVIEATVPARDINNQAALDLFAQIELDRRGGVQEYAAISAHHGHPDATQNIPAGLEVGHVVTVTSPNTGISGDFRLQSIAYRMKTPTWSVVELELGDYNRKLAESMRRLDKIRVDPLVPPVPPPPNSITNEMVNNVNFSKVVMDVLIQSSQINTVNFSQVTSVAITDSMITSVSFGKITGTVTVNAANITGSINFASQVNSATVSITNAMLAGSIDFAKISSGTVSISNSQLAGSISFSKIDSATVSISNSQLAGSIDFSKINNATVTITNSNIANLTITGGKLADNTITSIKLVSVDPGKISAGTIGVAITVSSGGAFTCDGTLTVNGFAFFNNNVSASYVNATGVSGLVANYGVHAGTNITVGGVQVINSSRQFVGAGVDVGSNGIGCGGVNISGGYFGQTVTITGTFGSGITSLSFRGGVLVGYS